MARSLNRGVLGVVGLLSLLLANAAFAQPTAQSPAVLPHSARLDEAANNPDNRVLADLLFSPADADEARASLDWLGGRFQRGDSALIAFLYARMLASFANTGPVPADQANELKSTALAAFLYASAASMVDGLQCADGTARANRTEQFAAQLSTSGLMQLDEAARRKAAWVAVMIEQKTWPARRTRNDARFQCALGMAAMSAGLAAGQAKERAPGPGEIGRQVSVTPPADFVYQRRPDSQWWQEAEKVRAQLPAVTAKLAAIERIPTDEEMDLLLSAE